MWQVQQMEEAALSRIIGGDARGLKLRARGQGGTTLTPHRLPKSVSRETTLSRDLRDPSWLEAILALLTAYVAAQLREEQLVANTVTLKLRHDDFHTVTRRRTLEIATDLDSDLYPEARALFRRAFEDVRRRNRGVRLIGVAASGLATSAEADLFEPPDHLRQRQLAEAVDRVREKFGFDAVTPGKVLESKARRRRSQIVSEGPYPRSGGRPRPQGP